MNLLTLGIGIFLPWVCGYLLLARLQGRYSFRAPENLRQIAYGFFAGYALLYLLLVSTDQVFGRIQFLTVVIGLSLVTAGLAWRLRCLPLRDSAVPFIPSSRPALVLLALLGFWILLHLGLALAEVLHRPVFPWDAWLVWVYRAKAWFYQGGFVEMLPPSQWQASPGAASYVVEAFHYPKFASAIPFWVATCFGQWSETLLGIPALLAGFAVALGLYSQCRIHGLAAPAAIVAGYLLVSTPLVGAHLALAGYADIWVMGFVGLGLVCVVGGLWTDNLSECLMGLAMVLFSLLVKSEGIVWLYLAVVLVVLSQAPVRWLLLCGAAGLLLVGLAVATGTSGVDLPVLGKLGVVGNTLYLPFVEPQVFEARNLLDTYIKGMFVHGSWSLLWIFAAVLVVLFPFSRERKLALVVSLLLVLVIVSQWLIFGFTAQGEWATSFTAANRVLLHLLPVILFSIAVTWQSTVRHAKESFAQGGLLLGLAMLLAAVLAAAAAVIFLGKYAETGQVSARLFDKQALLVPVGGGEHSGDALQISRYRNGVAIVSTGTVRINAEDLPVVAYQLRTESAESPELFWRTLEQKNDVHRIPIEKHGRHVRYMGNDPNWSGTITELGVIFRGRGKRAAVSFLAVRPATLQHIGAVVADDWTAMVPWTQKSVNWVPAGRDPAMLHPNAVATAWAITSVILVGAVIISSRRYALFTPYLAISLLAAWMLLDVRWTWNRFQQVGFALQYNSLMGSDHYLEIGRDEEIAAVVRDVKGVISSDTARSVLVYSPHTQDIFTSYRAKYQLLPHSAHVHQGDMTDMPAMDSGYVLALDWADTGMQLEALQADLQQRLGRDVSLAWRDLRHALFVLGDTW